MRSGLTRDLLAASSSVIEVWGSTYGTYGPQIPPLPTIDSMAKLVP